MRPRQVLEVALNRFLPICLHILSHISSALSSFIVIPFDSYPSECPVHPVAMSVEQSHQTSSPAPLVQQSYLLI